MSVAERRITPADLESKFRELQSDVEETADSARNYMVIGGMVAVVVLVAAAFFLGKRKGRMKSTFVEIKHI
jgi:hypothetical protein